VYTLIIITIIDNNLQEIPTMNNATRHDAAYVVSINRCDIAGTVQLLLKTVNTINNDQEVLTLSQLAQYQDPKMRQLNKILLAFILIHTWDFYLTSHKVVFRKSLSS